MRTGKISENVLKRSVLKRIHTKNDHVVQGPGVGRDCAIFHIEGKNSLVTATQPVVYTQPGRLRQAIAHAMNNCYCAGAQPIGFTLSVMLPETAEEALLRDIMEEADSCCAQWDIGLGGGHTEVSGAVNKPLITVSVMAEWDMQNMRHGQTAHAAADVSVRKQDRQSTMAEQAEHAATDVVEKKLDRQTGTIIAQRLKSQRLTSGLDLVMTGYAGMEGTAILARKHEQELLAKFPLDLVEQAKRFDKKLLIDEEVKTAYQCGAKAFHDVSQGGIFGALWEFGERDGVGMNVDLRKIPLKQETVEICEVFGKNPYYLQSSGALLIALEDGQQLVMELAARGIPAVVIGRTTDKKEKVLQNGEEIRYLDKPAQDALWSE